MSIKPDHKMIMGHRVAIVYKDMGEKDIADFKGSEETITLNTNKEAHWNGKALFHETLHGIFFYSGLTNFMSTRLEEGIVECLENNLWPMIKFNY